MLVVLLALQAIIIVTLVCVWSDVIRIEKRTRKLIRKGYVMSVKVDEILASVAELDTINDSLEELFTTLEGLLADPADTAKIQQALEILTTEKERTKAAIVAHTPAAPPTP